MGFVWKQLDSKKPGLSCHVLRQQTDNIETFGGFPWFFPRESKGNPLNDSGLHNPEKWPAGYFLGVNMALGGGLWIATILGFVLFFVWFLWRIRSHGMKLTMFQTTTFWEKMLGYFFQPPNSRKSNDSRHSLSHSTLLQALNSTSKFTLPLFFWNLRTCDSLVGILRMIHMILLAFQHYHCFFLKLIWIIHSLDKPSTFGRYLWILGARQGLLDSAVLNIDSLLVVVIVVVLLLLLVFLVVVVAVAVAVAVVVVVVVGGGGGGGDDLQSRTVPFPPVVAWYVSNWCPGINGQILEIVGGWVLMWAVTSWPWLFAVYRGWNTTQLYGDCNKPWNKNPY